MNRDERKANRVRCESIVRAACRAIVDGGRIGTLEQRNSVAVAAISILAGHAPHQWRLDSCKAIILIHQQNTRIGVLEVCRGTSRRPPREPIVMMDHAVREPAQGLREPGVTADEG